ncbi:hypothetical protein H8A00_10805 [Neisseria meningitidis]|uniref:hypothetical protein n=1 Tax=Neisseria meningitidis TaxID=487 RepID=UPI0016153DA3|nr:hypothetical protein [Neisseria meningitidis]MBG8691713.1 hypothetical protein [Neisseria meningitidis]MBG9199950.1 hypothetical protein [Neisseria meningitidis]MBJ1808052.1 hypothetical protein [Neisseria meningitidis]MBJ7790506.1 hypothetical protein [Neisseria meningitidis]MBJ7841689.1 hypothetical protein [Neisseria meningitidis]
MPSEPSDGIFDSPAVYRRGAGVGKCPNRHSRYTVILKSVIPDNTAISKFVIPAQAGIQTSDAAGIYRK